MVGHHQNLCSLSTLPELSFKSNQASSVPAAVAPSNGLLFIACFLNTVSSILFLACFLTLLQTVRNKMEFNIFL